HCYAALRDDLQVSTRREALMARRAARRGIDDRIIFGWQIRARPLSGQWRTGIRLRSGRVADHDANMGLLCGANRALRRRVHSSLRAGTRPRHSPGKACGAGRSEGNRVTTVDRSGRQVSLTSIRKPGPRELWLAPSSSIFNGPARNLILRLYRNLVKFCANGFVDIGKAIDN